MKLAAAPERAVAGDAASMTENHALTLGSRHFGSQGSGRIGLSVKSLGEAVGRSAASEIVELV